MTADQLSLIGVVLPLLPIAYFFLSSLTFFLASFRDPVVTRVLRGLFNTYLIGATACFTLGALAFAAAGRLPVAAALAAAACIASLARPWFLHRIDSHIAARDSGNQTAIPRLRRLHVIGIAYNAAFLLALLTSIPYVVTAH
jgi:hypothetical protein